MIMGRTQTQTRRRGMAEGASETYLRTLYQQFEMHATWMPGDPVECGEIGVLEGGAFVRQSDLKTAGFAFKIEKRHAPSMRFASSSGVEFEAKAKGELDKAVSAIAKADAGLKISFTDKGAIVFILDSARDEFICDVVALAEWMSAERGHGIKDDQIIITMCVAPSQA
jgi:hypothetical protein